MFEAWRKRRAERRAQRSAQNKLERFLREIARAIETGELQPKLSGRNDLDFEFSFRNVRISGTAFCVSDDAFGAEAYCSLLTLDGSEVHTLTNASSLAWAIIDRKEALKKEAESRNKNRLYQTLEGIVDHLPESMGNGKKSGELSLVDDRVGAVSLPE